MDGYSVQEAASVLGVGEGRVWELLARGVLLGTPEGDSMRVFLKGQPGPIASSGSREEPQRTNGNGGSHPPSGEASAFRELLTEFRNLTERYGQALLALGEARGEVAGLRSRVDQLEARFDLRLPSFVEAAPVAWEPSSGPASPPEPPSAPSRPVRPPRAAIRGTTKPRRGPSARETVAGFADALKRAQDPNAADLGTTASEAAPTAIDEASEPMEAASVEAPTPEPVAAEELVADEVAAEPMPVVEEPQESTEPEAAAAPPFGGAEASAVTEAAEPVELVEPEPPTYSAVVVEPDWFADGDFAWLDAAELEAGGQAEAATAEALAPAPEPVAEAAEPEAPLEPVAMQEPEVPAEPEMPETEVPQLPEMQAEAPRTPEPEVAPQPDLQFEATTDFEPWQPPVAPAPELPDEPEVADAPEPQTMSAAVAVQDLEEEVMWLGADPQSRLAVVDEPRVEPRAELNAWPAADAAMPVVEVPRPPLAMTEDELARLAMDEGWDESEVAAIRAMITPPSSSRVDLPGASELHEAMAALEAVPVQANPAFDVSRQWTKPAPDDDQPAQRDDWAFEAEPPPPAPFAPRPSTDVTAALRRGVTDPGWLRRRQGPAAAAYRRLRRLFPG
ncbi:MAG: hypothetical protein ACXWMN_02775 [Candidatus Limnocylindria bacterium]